MSFSPSDVFLTASDLTTLNDRNAIDAGASDLFDDAPLVKRLAATVASDGNIHKYIKQTGDAGSGFRAIDSGLANSKSTNIEVTANLQILDASFAVDKSAADGYIHGPDAYIARELRLKGRSAMFTWEKQIINGIGTGTNGTAGGNSAGFVGFADGLNSIANNYVINAGGTTASTAASVYLIRTNDLTDVASVIGNNGRIEVGETTVQRVYDANGNSFPAYYTPVLGWTGLQLGAVFSVVRIMNITADSGHGLTDALISKALELFPASRQPNLIAMGRRSLAQLQQSRTSYNPLGDPAVIPNQAFNIPIVVTDACTATEALITT